MLRFCRGSVFQSDAKVLVNPVNCVGVMGAGLALQFKQSFPGDFEDYRYHCNRKQLVPGGVLFTLRDRSTPTLAHLATKNHWKQGSQIQWIEQGLLALKLGMMSRHLNSVALPAIGCGLGGLEWALVRERIEQAFEGTDFNVEVFEPLEG